MKSKLLKLLVAAPVLAMMAGCIVLSVYPFYNAKDVVFDPALAGRWAKEGKTNEFWDFAAASGKSYLLTTVDEQETNSFEAHLFQLKQHRFLDLLTTNRSQFQMPLHLISRVESTGTNLSVQFMDFGWLTSYLETNPAVLKHILVPQNAEDTNNGNMLYLTASTRDLQVFLNKHAADTNAFNTSSAVDLDRVAP